MLNDSLKKNRASFLAIAVVGTVFIVGCAQAGSPTNPSSTLSGASAAVQTSRVAVPVSGIGALTAADVSGRPDYELAYYNGVSSLEQVCVWKSAKSACKWGACATGGCARSMPQSS